MQGPNHSPGLHNEKLEWGKIVVPAIIGLISVLVTAVCGCIGTYVMTYKPAIRNIPPPIATVQSMETTQPTQIPTRDVPVISMKDIQLADSVDIAYRGTGKDIGVVPTGCWEVYFGNIESPEGTIETISEVPLYVKFVVLSNRPVVISDISLHMDSFTPPPDPNTITEGLLLWGRGGGEVNVFDLSDVWIGSTFSQESLSDGTAYQLDENDSLVFRTTIYMIEPGSYTFHIEIQVETYLGESFAFTFAPMQYSWLYMENLEKFRFTNSDFGDREVIVKPTCK